jgi:hypothetical protein
MTETDPKQSPERTPEPTPAPIGPSSIAPSTLRSPRSQALFEALVELDGKSPSPHLRLADIYVGALTVRDQTANAEAIVLAAHGMRELMDKMPRVHGIPVRAKELSAESKKLIDAWDLVKRAKHDEEKTERAETFDAAMEGFATSFREPGQGRKKQAEELLFHLDQRGQRLPPTIERHRIAEWSDYESYFQNVSHHTRPTSTSEFDDHVAGLEDFLLSYLRPRTYDDRAKLAAIVEGRAGESRA